MNARTSTTLCDRRIFYALSSSLFKVISRAIEKKLCLLPVALFLSMQFTLDEKKVSGCPNLIVEIFFFDIADSVSSDAGRLLITIHMTAAFIREAETPSRSVWHSLPFVFFEISTFA